MPNEYRLTLYRELSSLGFHTKTVMFCMLNPSTATEFKNDPTISGCMDFGRRWGYSSLWGGNIFGMRSTDPKNLYLSEDIVGEGNNDALVRMAVDSDTIIAAWGNHGTLNGRGAAVLRILQDINDVYCLGMTSLGQPRHPLYIRRDYNPIQLMDIGRLGTKRLITDD